MKFEFKKKDIEKKEFYKMLFAFIIISLILFSSIFIIRTYFFSGIFPGHQTYYNHRIANFEYDEIFIDILSDDMISSTRTVPFEQGYFLLNMLNNFIKSEDSLNISIIIFILIQITNLILFMFLLRQFTKDLIFMFSSGLFLITSPQFIYLPYTLNPATISIFLLLILLNLILAYKNLKSKNKIIRISFLSTIIIFSILSSMTNIVNYIGIITIILGLLFMIRKDKNNQILFLLIIFSSLLSFFAINANIIGTNNISLFFNNYNLFENSIFAEMGSLQGIRIVDLFLSLIAIGLMWSRTKNNYITSLMAFSMIITSLFIYDLNSVIFPVFAILCGFSYTVLSKMKWDLSYIKKLCIVLIIISTFISCVQFIIFFSFEQPDSNKYIAAEFLSRLDKEENDTVLAPIHDGFLIETVSNMKTMIDSNLNGIKNADILLKEYNLLINTRSSSKVKELFNIYNIKYVYVDNYFKKDIWNSKVDGLYFVIKNSEDFELIYEKNDVKVYEFYEKEKIIT